ncbi:MAG: ATP-binding protein [Balneolales bacterium]
MNSDWTITRLEKMINDQVEENTHLDYKSADALQKTAGKKKEVTKDVSAFANSDGGVIIYGLKEFDEPEKNHLPEAFDFVDGEELTKEWLEHVIGNISPRINSVRIIPLRFNDDIKKSIYVVEIQKSTTAHQAMDYRYYKRYNFESIPMEDFEIRDVMNRITYPTFEIEYEIIKKTVTENSPIPLPDGPKVYDAYYLNCVLRNTGNIYGMYVNCFVDIPLTIMHEKELQYKDYSESDLYYRFAMDNTTRDMLEYNGGFPKYGPARYEPILPKTIYRLASIRLIDDFDPTVHKGDELNAEIYVDNSPMKSISNSLTEIQIYDQTDENK